MAQVAERSPTIPTQSAVLEGLLGIRSEALCESVWLRGSQEAGVFTNSPTRRDGRIGDPPPRPGLLSEREWGSGQKVPSLPSESGALD
jgi:hypothetical protein